MLKEAVLDLPPPKKIVIKKSVEELDSQLERAMNKLETFLLNPSWN
jgi:hypothetical protein